MSKEDRERGVRADPRLTNKLVDTISARWEIPSQVPKTPVLLLFGGFQGSGKTSVADLLAPQIPTLVISPDEIRHLLFQEIQYSETFDHTVHAIRNLLIEKALSLGLHIALDENATPTRMSVFRSLVKDGKHKILTVLLNTPEDVLKSRVGDRPEQPGKYKGTVGELETSMRDQGDVDPSQFDLTFHTDHESPDHIAQTIFQKINSIQ